MQSWLAGHAQLPGADTNLDGLANAHQRRLCACLLQLADELSKGSGGACWNRGSGGLFLLGRPRGSMGNKGRGGLFLLGRRGKGRGRGVVHHDHVDGGFGFHCLCCCNAGGFGVGYHLVCFAAVPTKYSGT